MQGVFQDLTGQRFGKLVVLGPAPGRRRGYTCWKIKCDCGSPEKIASTMHLTRKVRSIISCGCLLRKPSGQANRNRVLRDYKRNSKKRGSAWGISDKQFDELITSDCHYCGVHPSNICNLLESNGVFIFNGIDRIDNQRGYATDNVVPCCKACNWAKGKMAYEDFMKYLERVARYWMKKQTSAFISESKVMAVGSR